MTDQEISRLLHDHYRRQFIAHGATSQGVDWGDKEWAARLRQEVMLNVRIGDARPASILDVGCGYGSLADVIRQNNIPLEYTGIDIVEEMVVAGVNRHPECRFIHGDVLDADLGMYDYVVCNGILTQKMSASTLEMNRFAQELIKRLFSLCRIGIAFNLMSTYVNFQKDNLYYRNPAEVIAWCMSELSPRVRLDSTYQLWYEYTVYLYKPEHS